MKLLVFLLLCAGLFWIAIAHAVVDKNPSKPMPVRNDYITSQNGKCPEGYRMLPGSKGPIVRCHKKQTATGVLKSTPTPVPTFSEDSMIATLRSDNELCFYWDHATPADLKWLSKTPEFKDLLSIWRIPDYKLLALMDVACRYR